MSNRDALRELTSGNQASAGVYSAWGVVQQQPSLEICRTNQHPGPAINQDLHKPERHGPFWKAYSTP